MSSFQDLRVVRSQHLGRSRGMFPAGSVELHYRERERESMRVTTFGLCLRVIVNEKPLNLEKTTYSVLSV